MTRRAMSECLPSFRLRPQSPKVRYLITGCAMRPKPEGAPMLVAVASFCHSPAAILSRSISASNCRLLSAHALARIDFHRVPAIGRAQRGANQSFFIAVACKQRLGQSACPSACDICGAGLAAHRRRLSMKGWPYIAPVGARAFVQRSPAACGGCRLHSAAKTCRQLNAFAALSYCGPIIFETSACKGRRCRALR